MHSKFAEKFLQHAAITELMDDLNEGVQTPGMLMLGGGNPAQIPDIADAIDAELQARMEDGSLVQSLMNYDGPQGKDSFRLALADVLTDYYGTPVTPDHIALTNGSQSAFFYLMNLFAGTTSDGVRKRVMLPVCPEYIGYGDLGVEEGLFCTVKPRIELLPNREFKYHPDFNALELDESIGVVCVSRPTNPSGNVVTDDELAVLDQACRSHQIPLIIDNAYGAPFPNILFESVQPIWNDNIILCLSLSKLGLPGARCGIVVARPEVIKAVNNLNAIMGLAPGSAGPIIAQNWVRNGDMLRLSNEVVKTYYQSRAQQVADWLKQAIPDERFRIHKPEGAIFLWLWFDELPVTSRMLYRLLKDKGLLLVAGEHFFPGLTEPWPHKYQCMRLSYAAPEKQVIEGISILANVINELYQ
ncbi:valine--pyruvate transaminase [Echinimonas agarilytica]|uniref:Valine--pyruvate transaminase n=1 Tax=Echinimonas agarilytica TaxID=1215918 RepID=A0AA41W4N0_9GAMM|nr:valine--pyruvate transaminase [Echinimonas agarilytica]MCM2678874.1 valine--pyruvate transaminase [Echinimonas agarilytica]